MTVLQPAMRDAGGPTVQKPATAGMETEAVMLRRAGAAARPVSPEAAAMKVRDCAAACEDHSAHSDRSRTLSLFMFPRVSVC